VVIITGDVAEIEEAIGAGIEAAGHHLVDRLLLPQAAAQLVSALGREAAAVGEGSLGILETFSVASSVLAADAACKAAEVELCELRLGDGLGGKAYFVLTGEQADVEAALLAGELAVPSGLLLGKELIARPHADLLGELKR
jgi:microcompartment protein CcmL/EutN